MFIEYVTALIISYSFTINGNERDLQAVIWFRSEDDCQHAFQFENIADDVYAHLMREYGKDIMMSCEPTNIVSVPMNLPLPRPKELEE